ncbi:signal recognition particle receptor subunit alpha [Bdellovibrio bacteriovorus]|uniref:signal recognition particle receptor subunit alpha n=1 Tax=Bdellovibrio bacteriovorus TaxID=959 RepID=UPI0035A5F2DF
MMSPGHEQQIQLLFGAVALLLLIIFGVIFLSIFKRLRQKPTAKAVAHEVKTETAKEEGETTLARVDSMGQTVSEIEIPSLTAAVEEKAVDLKEALKKTEENLFGRIRSLFKAETSNKHLDEIEEILYTSDLGPTTVQRLMGAVEDKLSKKERADYETVREALKEEIKNIFAGSHSARPSEDILSKIHFAAEGPTVLMIVGVNGAGKTTSIGKISAQLASQGKKSFGCGRGYFPCCCRWTA